MRGRFNGSSDNADTEDAPLVSQIIAIKGVLTPEDIDEIHDVAEALLVIPEAEIVGDEGVAGGLRQE